MIIVGFDPGSVATGYGVVSFRDGRLVLESCGVFRLPPTMTLAEKLDRLFRQAAD